MISIVLSDRFAYILKCSGVGYKDVVVNSLYNCLERAVTDMGIIMAGAAPINGIPSLTSGEVFYSSARRSEAKAVIVYPSAPDHSDWVLVKEGIVGASSPKNKGSENGLKSENKTTTKAERNCDDGYKTERVIFDFKAEKAPNLSKAIIISRSSPWQKQELPMVPHFLQYLRNQPEKNTFVETKVVPSNNGYLFTTTGTTGMQKIVPRSHSILLKISKVMGQMAPGKLPHMFYTTKLGWNSGFPYMFYLFGSTLIMLDEQDTPINLGNEVAGKHVKDPVERNVKPRAQFAEQPKTASKHAMPTAQGNGENDYKEKGNANNEKTGIAKSKGTNNSIQEMCTLYDRYWCIMKKERVRFAYLSPDEIEGMATSAERADSKGSEHRDKLLLVVTGGLPIKHNIVCSSLKNVSRAITVGYGMTEAGVVSSNVVQRPEDYIEGDCGRLFRGVQCRIKDDAGNLLPPGQTGTIEFKTETIFEGFLNNVEKTHEALTPDGWFTTSDLGFIAPDGTIHVVCRKGNVILHSSVLVYPTAVESVLMKCPGVKDVVVVPVPDKIKHHNVCACIITQSGSVLTEEGVQKSMDDLLAVPRGPELVTPHHVLFMDSFPMIQNFKVDRKKLEKMAADCISKRK